VRHRKADRRKQEIYSALYGSHPNVHPQRCTQASIPLMVSHTLVIGYHGRDQRIARKVISLQEDLKPSQNAWDWLGHGIYFWEDRPSRAEQWTLVESKRHDTKIKYPAVLGAVIDLGQCLNLTDAEALTHVKTAHDEYSRFYRSANLQMAQNRGLIYGCDIWVVP
jgi:hypothetical protein